MITIIILIYMVIGVMVSIPLTVIGLKCTNYLDQFNEDEIMDNCRLLGIGLGALASIMIWPYWLIVGMYEAYLKPDED